MKKLLLILSLLIITGCSVGVNVMHKEVSLETEDNFEIKADYFDASSDKSLILLHQLSMTKHSWKNFAQKAQVKGYNVLAIDLRGHGVSQGDWEQFNDKDFINMILDVKAANNFLKEKYPKTKIAVIGASIGANLAIQYLAKFNISTSIALSPGINYRGLDISKEINKVDKNLLILVGKGDSYSYNSSQQIAKNNKVELKAYETSEHGTNLLNDKLEKVMLGWLEKNMK